MTKRFALHAKSVHTLPVGVHNDGMGLRLIVKESLKKDGTRLGFTRSWVLRAIVNGKRRDIGLGSLNIKSLAEARQQADEIRRQIVAGTYEPVREKNIKPEIPKFGPFADDYISSQKAGWKNDKHIAQWSMTMRVYADPIRDIPVDQITSTNVRDLLLPIWTSKPETATRTRERIERILDAARAAWHIDENRANPARLKGNLDLLLPRRKKGEKQHHAAMDYRDLPVFFKELQERVSPASLALQLTILTAARTSETLLSEWQEIDFKSQLWTIPADRMKRSRTHRVPLCHLAIEILQKMEPLKDETNFVFPGQRIQRPLSNQAMEMLLRRMGRKTGVTVHGFRSSFRDWAGDKTSHAREVIEAALSHAVGDTTEAAYRRSDALDKRRKLMAEWEAYLLSS